MPSRRNNRQGDLPQTPPPSYTSQPYYDQTQAYPSLNFQHAPGMGFPAQQAMPQNQQMMPQNQQMMHQNPQMMPQNPPMMPQNQQMMPHNQQIMPQNQQMMPQNQQMMPQNQQIMPQNQQMMPQNQQIMPQNQQMMPQNHQMMPQNHQMMPLNHQMMPPNHQMMPPNLMTHGLNQGMQQTPPMSPHHPKPTSKPRARKRDALQPKTHIETDSPPPTYDQACAPSTKFSKAKPLKMTNHVRNAKEYLAQNSHSVEEDRENEKTDRNVSTPSPQERAVPERTTVGRRGRGNYSRNLRGGRGKLRGKYSMIGSRGRQRSRVDLDQGSEITTSSIGLEQDELSVEVQRQLIEELEFAETETDSKAILIEVKNGYSDYKPLALKNFLEYCAGRQSRVVRMVVASDKQSVIAIFDSEIDCDELEAFVAEPQNQFLDLELDFEDIDELSAAIIFSDEEAEKLVETMFDPDLSDYIKDTKQSDDVIVMSFENLDQNDLLEGMETLRENNLAIYPLYPYPKNKCMHVIRNSFIDFDLSDDPPNDDLNEPDGYKILLTQVDCNIGDRELRQVVKLKDVSGGDTSAKIIECQEDSPSQKVVIYSSSEVCNRVMNFSPIKMPKNDRVVGYPSIRVDVPISPLTEVSKHFLLLTGVGNKNLSKDVLQYFITNHTRHTVQQLYFTKDEQKALAVFASEVHTREPGYADLYEALRFKRKEIGDGVMAWRVAPVTRLKISPVTNQKKVNEWKESSDVNVSIDFTDQKILNLKFTREKDAVEFLARNPKDISFGSMCMEVPVVDALASSHLYSEKLSAIEPDRLLISEVVESLGFSEDHVAFVKFSKHKKLLKLYDRCSVFCHNVRHEYRYDKSRLDSSLIDVATHMKNWSKTLKDSLHKLLAELKVMEETTVRKSAWFAMKKQKPANLFVIENSEGPKNMRLRALGTAEDVKKLEDLLTNSAPEKETSSESITFSLEDASFFRHNYLPTLQKEFPNSILNINNGSEFATLTMKGDTNDLQQLNALVKEYKDKLMHRRITITEAQWQFLNNRTSRAFSYVNTELLEDVQYFCVTKDNHKLVALTSTYKEKLNLAESVLRKEIIVRNICIESLEEWTQFTKPMVERLFRNSKIKSCPYLITEPPAGSGKVTIVTVKGAEETLDRILSMAKGTSENPEAGDSKGAPAPPKKPKAKKKSKPKKDKAAAEIPAVIQPLRNLTIQSESESDDDADEYLGARPKNPPRFPPQPEIQPLMNIRAMAHILPGQAHGRNRRRSEKQYEEEIKLGQNYQYIVFQYVSHFYEDMADIKDCYIDVDERAKAITIKADTKEEAKKVQSDILTKMKKLDKQIRQFRQGVAEINFTEAARELKLRFLLNSSVELLDYNVHGISVKACKPTIQCITADAIIIAVKNDLYMNQSNLGSLLAAADSDASYKLRKRYDSSHLDMPGTCQELSSETKSVLWHYYLVVVIDPSNKDSLRWGFRNALIRCQSLGIGSVVTNLLGSDMRQFVNDKESASIIMNSLSDFARSQEKRRLHTVYLCETNDFRIRTLTTEIKKHGNGVEFVDNKLPEIGCSMISVCSKSKRESEEFFRRCSQYLVS